MLSCTASAEADEDAAEGGEPAPAEAEPELAAWAPTTVQQQAASAAAPAAPAPAARTAAAVAKPTTGPAHDADTPAEMRAIRAAADRIAAAARLLRDADRSSAQQLAGLGLAAEAGGSGGGAVVGDALETRMAAAAAGLAGWLACAS